MAVTVTLSDFLVRYPEFHRVACDNEAFVTEVLEEAHLSVDQDLAGTKAEMYIKAKAAQLIASSPCGILANLASQDGATPYDAIVLRLSRSFALGCRVLNGTVGSD